MEAAIAMEIMYCKLMVWPLEGGTEDLSETEITEEE